MFSNFKGGRRAAGENKASSKKTSHSQTFKYEILSQNKCVFYLLYLRVLKHSEQLELGWCQIHLLQNE